MKGKISIKYLLLVIIGALAFATILAVSSSLVQEIAGNALSSAIN